MDSYGSPRRSLPQNTKSIHRRCQSPARGDAEVGAAAISLCSLRPGRPGLQRLRARPDLLRHRLRQAGTARVPASSRSPPSAHQGGPAQSRRPPSALSPRLFAESDASGCPSRPRLCTAQDLRPVCISWFAGKGVLRCMSTRSAWSVYPFLGICFDPGLGVPARACRLDVFVDDTSG